MPTRNPYASDLSDDEWEILRPLVPKAKPGGRPRAHQSRELLNAIFFYVLRGGCAWSFLPPRLLLTLADRLPLLQGLAYRWHPGADAHRPAREAAPSALGTEPTPSAAIIDSQRRPRQPRRAASAATTVARRLAEESGICSSTRKAW